MENYLLDKVFLLKIGNTRVSLAEMNRKSIHHFSNQEFSLKKLAGKIPSGAKIYAVSVVPRIEEKLRRFGKSREIQMLQPRDFQFNFAYSSGLGVDRCLNIYGLREFYRMRRPRLVFDFGTAITVDLIDQKGRHRGGWILPGPRVTANALFRLTAQLPELVLKTPMRGNWGMSTRECLMQGQQQMLHSIIMRAESLAKEQFHQKPKLILTGGWQTLIEYPMAVRRENLWRDSMEHLILNKLI